MGVERPLPDFSRTVTRREPEGVGITEEPRLAVGETVYDDGTALGTVRGFDEDGFFITTRVGMEALSIEHERAGHEFGGGGTGVAVFAVWRRR